MVFLIEDLEGKILFFKLLPQSMDENLGEFVAPFKARPEKGKETLFVDRSALSSEEKGKESLVSGDQAIKGCLGLEVKELLDRGQPGLDRAEDFLELGLVHLSSPFTSM